MLSVTAVPRERLYRNMDSAPVLPYIGQRKPALSTKQALKTQKLFTDLNAEFLDNNLSAKRHSLNTKIQSDSFFNKTEPKLELIQHQCDVSRQTIAGINDKLTKDGFDVVDKLKRKVTELDAKSSFIANKSTQELKNTGEICEKQVKHVEWVYGVCQSKIGDSFSNSMALKEKNDNMSALFEDVFEKTKNRLKVLIPKFSAMDLRAQEIESTLQQMLIEYKAMMQLLAQLKQANKMLKYIEEEGTASMVAEHYSKIVAHLTEISSSVDKKIVEKEITQGECEEKILMNHSENEVMFKRLDLLSKQFQDNETNMTSLESLSIQQLDATVQKLTENVQALRIDIYNKRKEMRHNRWRVILRSKRNLRYASKVAQVRSETLASDWKQFDENNGLDQAEANSQVDELIGQIGGNIEGIAYRIDVAYEKIQWCRKRLLQWQRSNSSENDVVVQKVIDSEANLLEVEQLLQEIDGKPPILQPHEVTYGITQSIESDPPMDSDRTEHVEIEFPDRQLTYSDEQLQGELEEVPPDPFEEEEFVDEDEDDINLFMFPNGQQPENTNKDNDDLNEEDGDFPPDQTTEPVINDTNDDGESPPVNEPDTLSEGEPKPTEEEPNPTEEEPKPTEEEPKPTKEEPKPTKEEPNPTEETPNQAKPKKKIRKPKPSPGDDHPNPEAKKKRKKKVVN